MSVAKVIEINAASNESFEDAINAGISKAGETVHNVRGAWGQGAAGDRRRRQDRRVPG